MAHFAEIDENDIVLRVIVVGDKDTQDQNGNEDESVGVAFCKSLYGQNTRWVQTSFNTIHNKHYNAFTRCVDNGVPKRKNYAGIGYTYDRFRDAFIPPKPFPSWSLDEETGAWNPPIPCPKPEHKYHWDEPTQQWILNP